jgi:hypothetical protein
MPTTHRSRCTRVASCALCSQETVRVLRPESFWFSALVLTLSLVVAVVQGMAVSQGALDLVLGALRTHAANANVCAAASGALWMAASGDGTGPRVCVSVVEWLTGLVSKRAALCSSPAMRQCCCCTQSRRICRTRTY